VGGAKKVGPIPSAQLSIFQVIIHCQLMFISSCMELGNNLCTLTGAWTWS
jgi:hypothetical protein